MSFFQILVNNWQFYALIFGMIFFVLSLLIGMLVCIAKQDDPDIKLPKPIAWFMGDLK